jgi:hypothetical protein
MAREIEPEGERLRRAVRWISEQRQEHPDASMRDLVDEAGLRFDLGPSEQDGLMLLLAPLPTGM